MSNPGDLAPKDNKAQTSEKEPAAEITGEQVTTFLKRNPEFFVDHPAALDGLRPPERDQGEDVIDLQQVMLSRLRDEIEELSTLRDDLLAAGRSNQSIQDRVHKSVLSLMEARSFEQFIEAITTDIAVILDLDVIIIGVEQSDETFQRQPPPRGIQRLAAGQLDAVFGPSCHILLHDDVEGDAAVFGEGSGLVRSQALIRLNISAESPKALLALGSRRPDQFHSGQGTELLNFLARVIESCFRSWLDLSPS